MSGHSKWSTIKRQKGAADIKRGNLFTKLSNAITAAVRQGGGIAAPESNFKLRLAVDRAQAANMPKDNIERAILRAQGKQGAELEELLYEGFGPGGAALMIEAVTDNKQRTVSEVKNVLEKNGGILGNPGSVSYLFNKKGVIIAAKSGISSDELLARGIAAGAEDMEEESERVIYYTDPARLSSAKSELEKRGTEVISADTVFEPSSFISQNQETQAQTLNLIERLEELDDVQKIYTNLA
jgi:YebC/PmpR family DNA-binding regulatory protein